LRLHQNAALENWSQVELAVQCLFWTETLYKAVMGPPMGCSPGLCKDPCPVISVLQLQPGHLSSTLRMSAEEPWQTGFVVPSPLRRLFTASGRIVVGHVPVAV